MPIIFTFVLQSNDVSTWGKSTASISFWGPKDDSRPAGGVSSAVGDGDPAGIQPAEIAGIIELPAFERFAFVMSVLEHISDQECSLLLDCSRGEVSAARSRALQQMGRAARLQRKLAPIGSADQALRDDPGAALQLEVPSLAAV